MAADHYALLGVPKDATSQDIKRAFRRIARECHPDIAGEDPERVARFHDARMAYEILMDPVTRARYDRRGQRRAPSGGSFFDAIYKRTGEMAAEKAKQNPRSGARVRGGPSNNDIGLDDLLGGFGGSRSKPQTSEPQRGPGPGPAPGRDIELDVEVPANVARDGGAVTVTYYRMRRADQWAPGDQDPGLVRIEDLCRVRVLPGTADGTVLREKGMGDAGAWGGTSGDLIARVKIVGEVEVAPGEEKSTDHRVDLSVTQALLGARLEVQTPQGPVQLTIPPGTSSHERMRLRGKGPTGGDGEPGDLYVTFRIVVPKEVSLETQQLLGQLAWRLSQEKGS